MLTLLAQTAPSPRPGSGTAWATRARVDPTRARRPLAMMRTSALAHRFERAPGLADSKRPPQHWRPLGGGTSPATRSWARVSPIHSPGAS
jgi:hypothetical protein